MKTFGEKLKEIRDEKGYSQKQVADELGLHRSNYSKIENNHQKMTHEQLALFCDFLNVSADYLLSLNIEDKVVYHSTNHRELELKIKELSELIKK